MTEAEYNQSKQDAAKLPESIFTVYEARTPGRPIATTFSGEDAVAERRRLIENRTGKELYLTAQFTRLAPAQAIMLDAAPGVLQTLQRVRQGIRCSAHCGPGLLALLPDIESAIASINVQ